MWDRRTRQDQGRERRRGIFRFDWLLLTFLAVGWSLIFVSATLGLQRNARRWLPVSLVAQVSADYGVDSVDSPKLAPVRAQMIEAVRADALLAESPTAALALAEVTPVPMHLLVGGPTPTPTSSPTLTPTPTGTLTPRPVALTVSVGGPYLGKEGSSIPLLAMAVSTVPGAVTYQWDLNDDGQYDDAEGKTASVVFYDEGDFPIGVQAIDSIGRVARDVGMVMVSNVAPTINAGGARFSNEGQELRFLATVEDPGHDLLLYAWDFGDGTGETGTLRPRHTYLDDGDYRVRLRAEDNDGGVSQASFIAHVRNLPPIVNAGPDRLINEGDAVAFNGVARDLGTLDTLSYAWDLDYNGVAFTPDAFGPTASRVYVDGPAAKMAALRVWDNDGGETVDTVNVTVGNLAPTILGVTNDGPVGEGSPLTLAVSATDVGSDTLTFGFDWNNDGVMDAVNQPARVSHTWYDQGSYSVGIGAYDGDGGQAYITTTVSAYNVAPTAIGGPPIARFEGSPILFDGGASIDPGIFDPLTYLWDFGDGSPVTGGISVTHTYVDNNVYTTTLSVTDNSGAGSTDAVSVAILNANPIAEAGSDRAVDEGAVLNFVGTASDPGAADSLSLAWDFVFDGVNFTEDAAGSSVDVPYPDGPANYLVAFRVRDDDYPYPTGGGGEVGEVLDVFQVTVKNLPPVVEAGGPYIAHEGQDLILEGRGADVPADALTYQWDLNYDGVYDVSGQSVVTSWITAGVYTVTLRVADDDGGSNLDIARVMIGNQPPIAEAGGPYTGNEGVPITLSGVGIDPNGDPVTYTWDLDYDGIFETPGQVISDTWPDEGVYTVTLEVIDGLGGVGIDDAIVTVFNVPPVPDSGGPYTTTVGASVTLTGDATDVPADTVTYAWDLDNNGTFEATGRIVNRSWITAGTYTVILQANDGDGGVATDAATVHVGTLVPIAWFGASYFLVWSKRAVSSRRRADRSGDHSKTRWHRRGLWG